MTAAFAQIAVIEVPVEGPITFVEIFVPGIQGPEGPVGPIGPMGVTTWDAITGKPATYPPTLPIAQSGITNLVVDLAGKANMTGGDSIHVGLTPPPNPAVGDLWLDTN